MENHTKFAFHVFCDASAKAYACAIFVRVERTSGVSVHLLAAKSRVAPIKTTTIPRLELLSATIACRLYLAVQSNFEQHVPCHFWTDSSTVLCWIRHNEEWSAFVHNRIKEIRSLTSISAWRHVPGHLNPADLPWRGCSAKALLETHGGRAPMVT